MIRVLSLLVAWVVMGQLACSHVQTETATAYYFSHSMLNFERRPLYPKRAVLPERAESSPEKTVVGAGEDFVESDEEFTGALGEDFAGSEPVVENRRERELGLGDEGRRRFGQDELAEGDDDSVTVAAVVTTERNEASEEAEGTPLALLLAEPRVQKSGPASSRSVGVRQEVLQSARRLLGIRKDLDSEGFVRHVLKVNSLELMDEDSATPLRDLYKDLRGRGLAYDREEPIAGDLVFFHNTHDRNRDGRNNDWYSGCGVVSRVSDSKAVHFIAVINDEVQEGVMNLARPEVRRDESRQEVLNSFLRPRRLSDAEYSQYLAGELFAGYASVALP